MMFMRHLLRTFIISVEFAILLATVGSLIWWGNQAIDLSSLNEKALEFFIAIPGILFVYSALKSESILFPDGQSKSVLHQWPDYWKLKVTVYVGLAYSLIFFIFGIFGWFMLKKSGALFEVFLVISSVIGLSTVVVTQYFAHVDVRELLSRNA